MITEERKGTHQKKVRKGHHNNKRPNDPTTQRPNHQQHSRLRGMNNVPTTGMACNTLKMASVTNPRLAANPAFIKSAMTPKGSINPIYTTTNTETNA
jgi:hypothetical protein